MERFISKKQRDELLAELRIERERKFADRIRVILLIDEGDKYIDSELESRGYLTTQAVRTYVKKTFSVCYKAVGMTSLLHRIGFSYKKPKTSSSKTNSKDQRKFSEPLSRRISYWSCVLC